MAVIELSHYYVNVSHLNLTNFFFHYHFILIVKRAIYKPVRLVWFSSATPKSSLRLGALCVCVFVCVVDHMHTQL